MKPLDVVAVGMLTAAVALGSETVLAEPPQRKPNIVMIMTDDVGLPQERQGVHGDLGSGRPFPMGRQSR